MTKNQKADLALELRNRKTAFDMGISAEQLTAEELAQLFLLERELHQRHKESEPRTEYLCDELSGGKC